MPPSTPATLERIRRTPSACGCRALEVLDQTIRQLECSQVSALEAIDTLLAEELTVRRAGASRRLW